MTEPGRDGESTIEHNLRIILDRLPLFGCLVAGLIGLAGAVVGMEKPDVRFNGGGIYLAGAAISFGLLANAMWRK